jgi:CheY-like chemotaxis protein
MHVILVDDTPEHLELLSEFITELRPEARVRCLQNGFELPRYLELAPTDLVLVDLLMPAMNGFDLVRMVREDERWRHLPIVAVSGLRAATEQQELQMAGFDDFMEKPYELTQLERILNQHVPHTSSTLSA